MNANNTAISTATLNWEQWTFTWDRQSALLSVSPTDKSQEAKQYRIEWIRPHHGILSPIDQPHSQHPFWIAKTETDYQVWLGGKTYTLPLRESKGKRQRQKDNQGPVGDIKAPMPGTILKILVAVGQRVEAQTPLVIMESMKMEMTLSSPGPATVKAIAAEAGQLVDMNALLIKLEPTEA